MQISVFTFSYFVFVYFDTRYFVIPQGVTKHLYPLHVAGFRPYSSEIELFLGF